MARVTSTQKLPTVGDPFLAKPRMMTSAAAMPTAGVTNCCTVSAIICERYDIVSSPP